MGIVRDIKAKVTQARKYLGAIIRSARRQIYIFAAAIGSTKVEDLLKETSSVPTLVSANQLGSSIEARLTNIISLECFHGASRR
jgi:hypothetical protein